LEAKDNVKYLTTLDKYIDVLYTGSISEMIETLPALLNNVKMMQQISRYYNTQTRMTSLYSKISNQMIISCRRNITLKGGLWDLPPVEVIKSMEQSLQLYEAYQEQYQVTRNKVLLQSKESAGHEAFEINENHIFGKFECFAKRLEKVIDMFSTVNHFSQMQSQLVEGMGAALSKFKEIVKEFSRKPYDLLDPFKDQFDRDYLDFQSAIHDVETLLQGFIDNAFETFQNTQQALNQLQRFQNVITRDTLRADLENKHMVIFQNYGLDLDFVQRQYEKYKTQPPKVYNFPPVAGNITWSRQLLRRIEEPMKKFQTNKTIMCTKESKKIIRTYNRVARALVEFETLWHQAWCKSIDAAKSGLGATLLVRPSSSRKLFANFDLEILQLIRETRCLLRLGVDVPEGARMVLMQDDKFKHYHGAILFTLREQERVSSRINPIIRPLLTAHLDDIDVKLQPGVKTITWTSLNIENFLETADLAMKELDDLVTKMSDVIENRIEMNLKLIGRTVLVDLDEEKFPFHVFDFVGVQEQYIKDQAAYLDGKNLEVENAVRDMLAMVGDPRDYGNVHRRESLAGNLKRLRVSETPEQASVLLHYNRLMYNAVLNCIRSSYNCIKKKVGRAPKKGLLGAMMSTVQSNQETPFFTTELILDAIKDQAVVMRPGMEEIQETINSTAVAILRAAKRLAVPPNPNP